MLKENLYNLGQKLGLNKKDIDFALKDVTLHYNKVSLSSGPKNYNWGSLYGAISIKDFLNHFHI